MDSFFWVLEHQQVRLEDGSAEWKFIMQVRTTSPLLGRLNPATLVANAQDMLDRAETQRREIDAARAKEGLLQVRQEDVDLTVVEDFLTNIRRKHNFDRHGSHEGSVGRSDEKLDADGGGGGGGGGGINAGDGGKVESHEGGGGGNNGGGEIESTPAAPARASRSNSSSSSSSIVEAVEAAAAASVDGAEIPNHAAILARIEMLEAKEGVRVVYVAIAHWPTANALRGGGGLAEGYRLLPRLGSTCLQPAFPHVVARAR